MSKYFDDVIQTPMGSFLIDREGILLNKTNPRLTVDYLQKHYDKYSTFFVLLLVYLRHRRIQE